MEFPLKYAGIFPEVWNALDTIPRSGWVKREILNPETTQQHVVSCRDKVIDMIGVLTEFSMSDIFDILNMLEVHDYPKTICGDEIIVSYNKEEKARLKELKYQREYTAMLKISGNGCCSDGAQILTQYIRFKIGQDRVASFARQINTFQSIEMAWFYQKRKEKVDVMEFVNYYRKDIVHPFIKKQMTEIESMYKSNN